VFRTHEPGRDRLVAVKAFRLDLVPEDAARLADSLRQLATAALAHPNIVAPVDAGLEGTAPYLAMDYVAGETLDVALRHLAPAPLDRALPLLWQAARAIEAAHAQGFGHGALHPRDLFVTNRGDVRVTGFGVVSALESVGARPPIRRPYAAPERATGVSWDLRADVYSLGAIAHELLTRRRPAGPGEQDGGLTPDIAPEKRVLIRRVLAEALAARPADRFATPTAFLNALEAIAQDREVEGLRDIRELRWSDEQAGPDERRPTAEAEKTDESVPTGAPTAIAATETTAAPASKTAGAEDRSAWWAPDTSAESGNRGPWWARGPETHRAAEPVKPAPVKPAPVKPAPVKPAPVKPAPVKPPPVERVPGEPTSVEPPPVAETPVPVQSLWVPGPEPQPADRPSMWERRDTSLLASELASPELLNRSEPPPHLTVSSRFPWVAVAAAGLAGIALGVALGYAIVTNRDDAQATTAAAVARPSSEAPAPTDTDVAVPPATPVRSTPSVDPPSSAAGPPVTRALETRNNPPRQPAPAEPAPVSTGRVLVRSVPAGAQILIDGRVRGETPLAVRDLPFGTHTLSVVRNGYELATERIVLTQAEPVRNLTFELRPVRVTRPPDRPPLVPVPRF
jgi:serine/threonine-protein kinase